MARSAIHLHMAVTHFLIAQNQALIKYMSCQFVRVFSNVRVMFQMLALLFLPFDKKTGELTEPNERLEPS